VKEAGFLRGCVSFYKLGAGTGSFGATTGAATGALGATTGAEAFGVAGLGASVLVG